MFDGLPGQNKFNWIVSLNFILQTRFRPMACVLGISMDSIQWMNLVLRLAYEVVRHTRLNQSNLIAYEIINQLIK